MASPLARPAHPHPRAFTGACSSHRADHALSAQDQCEQERRVGASRGAILTLPSSRCHPHAAILKLPSSRCLPQVAVLSLVALPSSRRLLCDAVFFAMPPSRCRPHDAALTMCPRDAALTMPPLRCRPHARDAVRRCRPPMPSIRPHASASACQRVCSSACQRVRVLASASAPAAAVQLQSRREREPSAQAERASRAVRTSRAQQHVATAAAAVIAIDCNG